MLLNTLISKFLLRFCSVSFKRMYDIVIHWISEGLENDNARCSSFFSGGEGDYLTHCFRIYLIPSNIFIEEVLPVYREKLVDRGRYMKINDEVKNLTLIERVLLKKLFNLVYREMVTKHSTEPLLKILFRKSS